MYCIICGSEGKTYENLCKRCFIKKTSFFSLPKVVKIKLCNKCTSWEKANHWELATSDQEAIEQLLISKLKIKSGSILTGFSLELDQFKTNIFKARVKVLGKFEDLMLEEQLETELRLNYTICPKCSRQSGNYYEAIVQLRCQKRALDDTELQKAEKIVDTILNQFSNSASNAFLTKKEFIHGGEDFYIGSSSAAKQIAKRLAKEFAGVIKESSTLIGRKEGWDIYRNTYNVRIPEYRPGDFIEVNNQIFQIKELYPKRIIGLDLKTGQTQNIAYDSIIKGKLLGGLELVQDAVVVLDSESEVQVLDPENYRTIDLVKPNNFKVTGDTVKVLKTNDDILLLPKSHKKILKSTD